MVVRKQEQTGGNSDNLLQLLQLVQSLGGVEKVQSLLGSQQQPQTAIAK